jgi:hypothetical protein
LIALGSWPAANTRKASAPCEVQSYTAAPISRLALPITPVILQAIETALARDRIDLLARSRMRRVGRFSSRRPEVAFCARPFGSLLRARGARPDHPITGPGHDRWVRSGSPIPRSIEARA